MAPISPTVFDLTETTCNGPEVAKHSRALGPQIGLRLSRVMKERGLTDRALAKEAQISFTTVQNLRRGLGGQAGVGTIWNIAKALGVTPEWLAFGKEPSTPAE